MNPLSMKKLAAWIALRGRDRRERLALSRRAAPGTVHVSGTVTDGSGHGWPLYARIEITSASTEPVVAYSDPVTGAYAADLAGRDGLHVRRHGRRARATRPGGGAVVTAGAPVVADWTLVAAALCNAPGYAPGTYGPPVFSESFDARRDSSGLDRADDSPARSWKVVTGADPCGLFDGNRTGGSGPYAIVNSNCCGFLRRTTRTS